MATDVDRLQELIAKTPEIFQLLKDLILPL